jgi:hypothetical protein
MRNVSGKLGSFSTGERGPGEEGQIMDGSAESAAKIHLIQSDDAVPLVRVAPGKRFEVVATTVVDSDLRAIDDETEAPGARPARLCGSRSTCVAIVELD